VEGIRISRLAFLLCCFSVRQLPVPDYRDPLPLGFLSAVVA
jgi:hypothetical protein